MPCKAAARRIAQRERKLAAAACAAPDQLLELHRAWVASGGPSMLRQLESLRTLAHEGRTNERPALVKALAWFERYNPPRNESKSAHYDVKRKLRSSRDTKGRGGAPYEMKPADILSVSQDAGDLSVNDDVVRAWVRHVEPASRDQLIAWYTGFIAAMPLISARLLALVRQYAPQTADLSPRPAAPRSVRQGAIRDGDSFATLHVVRDHVGMQHVRVDAPIELTPPPSTPARRKLAVLWDGTRYSVYTYKRDLTGRVILGELLSLHPNVDHIEMIYPDLTDVVGGGLGTIFTMG